MADKNWNRSYNEEDNSALRRLQLTELENLRIFSEICDKHGLRYYMVGGTMLGAIRHKGFIPWDDDADVGMPRPDYEKFIRIVRKELPEGYSFLNYKQNKDYKRYFSRIVNDAVTVVNASNTNTIEEKAWLDIFPFDGMPDNKLRQKLHFWHMTFIRFFYHASCFEELVNLNRPGRAWYLQAAIKFIQVTHIGKGLNTKKLMRRMERGLAKYPYDKSLYMVSFFGSYMEKEIVDKRLLGKGRKYPFETLELNGPVHYDEFLTHFYGDYMTPPKDADKDKHNIDGIIHKDDPADSGSVPSAAGAAGAASTTSTGNVASATSPRETLTPLGKSDCGEPIKQEKTKEILVDMLDALAKWCQENGMKYYLSGGTLLGAIRHKGFIPWDDDIDVNMSRPDVERMYHMTGGRLGRFILVRGGEDPYSPACQSYRLYNPDVIIENFQGSKKEKPIYHPVFIDICPIDGFPEGEKETKRFCNELILIRKMLGVSWHPPIMKKSALYAAANLLLYIPAKAVGYKRWVRIFQKKAQKYSFDDSKYVGVTTIVHYLPREKVLKKAYVPTVDVEFEGKTYTAPANWDEYLNNLYGDYMKMPPKDKQKSDHIFKVYKRSNNE